LVQHVCYTTRGLFNLDYIAAERHFAATKSLLLLVVVKRSVGAIRSVRIKDYTRRFYGVTFVPLTSSAPRGGKTF
jgi:hypothetical protein